MKCPIHAEELREEYHAEGRTGWCLGCLKHYVLCTSTRYMRSCDHLKDHPGPHRDSAGNVWQGSPES